MALIEAALAAAVSRPSPSSLLSSFSPNRLKGNARSIQSITVLSKQNLLTDSSPVGDIEDMGCGLTGTQKRIRLTESFFHLFRRKRGLSVTDLTGSAKKLVFVTNNSRKSRREYSKKFRSLGVKVSEDEIFSSSFAAAMYLKVNDFPLDKKVYAIGEEGILDELELAGFTGLGGHEWCEKQMEYILLLGKPRATKAMKAGSKRHVVLEEEVIQKVKVQIRTVEDVWALKFMNFMTGVNQLLFDGLTRELPVVGFVEGVWMVGIIDELRMPATGSGTNPKLVDTKTRVRNNFPSSPQQRNGRLQLMCYKYMWDNLAADSFPSARFFDFFSLDRHCILSEDI